MKNLNVFNNPEYYRKLILEKKDLLKYDISKNRGKSLICVFFTAYCGVGCPFCFFHSPSVMKLKSLEELEYHFNEEEVEKFVKFANDANVGYLQISGGGEPFLEKDAIIKCIKEVNADRIILVTSGSWACDSVNAEKILTELYNATMQRKKQARVTIRVSISEYHNIKLKNKPLVNLLKIFNAKYRDEKNFTLQLKTFENDNAMIEGLNEHFGNYKLNQIEDNGTDDINHIKVIPWKYCLTLESGYKVIVGKSRIFNSNLRPNLNDVNEIKKSEEIYDTDLLLSQKNNSSIVYNSNDENGLDWIVEYNGNVCTWQNRIQDNLLNIYEDDYEQILKSTYSDVLTYSYIDKGAIYRANIVNEISERSVSLMKSVNIRDYAGTLLFYSEKVRLYYTIRVIQDYLKENLINENVLKMLPNELIEAINATRNELKDSYKKSTYSIIDQELNYPIGEKEIHDLLELIKLGHYDTTDEDVHKLIDYYNFVSNNKINNLDEIDYNGEMEKERRLTRRMMKRKTMKSIYKEKYFYLCRHGETNWNVENRIKGQLENIDTAFTKKGLDQINRLEKFIQANDIQAIFSSDLTRTRETSKILNESIQLPLYYFKNFRGLNMGNFQGKTMKDFLKNDEVKKCFEDYNLAIPGGESINNLINRFMNGIKVITNNYNYDKIAIVSHGAAISNIKSFISKEKYEDIDYCIIKVADERFEIVDYGKYSQKGEAMNVFLTTNIGGIQKENGKKVPAEFSNKNNFLDVLKKSLKDSKKFVLVCSNPDNIEQNSKYLELDIQALNMSGIVFDEYVVLDNRNKTKVQEVLSDSSLIMLCGGNTYQQNKFFNEINLKKYISDIDAPVIGISAGSINAADNVYNSPECEEDIENPRILAGLNLTKINIEPHFDINSNNKIQMNSILSESHNRKIYGLPDGSYIKDDTIYGKCYMIHNGKIELICEDGEQYKIND